MTTTILCEHRGEQIEASTWGDMGRGMQVLICLDCRQTREAPYDWPAHFGHAPERRRDGETP